MADYVEGTFSIYLHEGELPELPDEWINEFMHDDNGEGEWYFSSKWSYMAEDVAKLSLQFPGVVFKVSGGTFGEDLWECYFKNGLMQECPAKIEYDDYDPEKLLPVPGVPVPIHLLL